MTWSKDQILSPTSMASTAVLKISFAGGTGPGRTMKRMSWEPAELPENGYDEERKTELPTRLCRGKAAGSGSRGEGRVKERHDFPAVSICCRAACLSVEFSW